MKRLFLPIFLCIFLSVSTLPAKPYLIIISIDACRYDYPDRGLTPNLTYLEQNGVRAFSLQPCFPSKTFPNHWSIVTGLTIEHHGLIYNHFSNPYTGDRFSLSDSAAVKDLRWYRGEALWTTAQKQGVKSASFFWPGSEQNDPFLRPLYYKHYNMGTPYNTRVDGILSWLKLPGDRRPHLLFLYFEGVDTWGHRKGPDSPELNNALKEADAAIGRLLSGLKSLSFADSINIIVLSDHGMAPINNRQVINISRFMRDTLYTTSQTGPAMMISHPNRDTLAAFKKRVQQSPHLKAWFREEMPKNLHFSRHPYILPLVVLANEGYSLITDAAGSYYRSNSTGGNHGYDNHLMSMHGIFIASGPAFKTGFHCGTLQNIDIYPLACKILGIMPAAPIDGRVEQIDFLLKP